MWVALYLRRSTDEKHQAESLAVQESRLREYAERNDYQVVEVFADSASGRSVKKRNDFARLLSVVQQGAQFSAVIVRDVSRWGRFENVDESAYFEFFLLLNNVKVIYAEEAFNDAPPPMASFLKAIQRMNAAAVSREKSRLVQAGHAHATKKGWRVHGKTPYGMDAIVVTREGKFVRRLKTGERKENSALRLKLAPTRGRAARIVKQIFDWYTAGRLSFEEIARRLNYQKVPAARKGLWRAEVIAQMLQNAAYAGVCRAQFQASANFMEPTVVETPNAWRGLISPSAFHAAQERLSRRRHYLPIDAQLRASFEDWGVPDEPDVTWASIRASFTHGEITATEAARAAPAAFAAVREITMPFETAEPTERGFLLNGVFEVGVRYSFPQLFNGRLVWDFRTSATEPEESTLFVGISPPPHSQPVRIFVLFTRRLKRPGRIYRPEIQRKRFRTLRAIPVHMVARKLGHPAIEWIENGR